MDGHKRLVYGESSLSIRYGNARALFLAAIGILALSAELYLRPALGQPPDKGVDPSSRPATNTEAGYGKLVENQRRLQRRWTELRSRFRDLAVELRESEPDQAKRVAEALEQADTLRLDERLLAIATQLERGENEAASLAQREIVEELARLRRKLLTGDAEPPTTDDPLQALAERIAELLAAQQPLTAATRDIAQRRPEDGAWRRADRLAIAKIAAQQRDVPTKINALWPPFEENPPESLGVIRAVLDPVAAELTEIAQQMVALEVNSALANRQRDCELAMLELLKILRPAQKPGAPEEGPMMAEGDEPPGAKQLPRSAQLRLLRSAQNRLLERTRVYESRFSGQTPSDTARQQLESLVRQQTDLDQQLRRILEEQ
jgi:hypothetical protein